MRTIHRTILSCALLGALPLTAPFAHGHGVVGARLFPATTATDDPFAVDELAFPTLSLFKNSRSEDGPPNREFDAGFEFDKEIFPHFALGVSDTYIMQRPHSGPGSYGWDNLTLTAKYEVWRDEAAEAIVSIGLEAEVGGTGSKEVSDNTTVFSPTIYFGKGFGDLPDSLSALRPFAVTGQVGQTLPTSAEEANTLEWGFALEYSLPYLQSQVKDIGLPAPFKDMIPLVEFSMETGENRGEKGHTTGTINPGVAWETPYFQLNAEALIPINSHSGNSVGFVLQLWIFIDNIDPKDFGHPIFGN